MIHRGGTTWTVMAVCLADNFAGNVPSSAVRLALNEAGLGQKKKQSYFVVMIMNSKFMRPY